MKVHNFIPDIKLPTECLCFSLRAGAIFIGFSIVVFGLFIFIVTLSNSIVKVHMREKYHQADDIYHFASALAREYGTCVQIIFAAYLLYGIFMRNSVFIFSWLPCQIAALISVLTDFFFIEYLWFTIVIEFLSIMIIVISTMTVIYSYYLNQPKSPQARIV